MNAQNLAQQPINTSANTLQPPIHEVFVHPGNTLQAPGRQRYQVILAGNRFFHIKETATGRVRGFRADHNEACALARNLEASH
ncbi:hypothetical protein SAMN04487857_12418 [Pseudomonas sp. ok272]|uniref:hypothetical protein n=1 Tax=unclassified Pseudomonas TaxID=196821 RepID=UPI0008BE82B2|nr:MULTISPECIES: hypothetical protein [unclassified Pseudomonas]SEN58693.1 hypothetical protein SAMN04487857_12418 [Pseudomonas sp. ok272]SFN37738.1 hypothetical protein SAMN04487858_12323 [Pseudomonas sp. ok602]